MPSPIEVILVPTLMILLGVILRQKSFLKQSDRDLLSDIVLYIALPAMIFVNLRKANISHDMLFLPILGIIASFSLLAIAYIYCRIRNYSKKTSWTIMIASSIMNTGFIGFPVSLGVFGNEGFLNAIFFDLSTAIMLVVYGIVLAKEFGGDRREAIRNMVTFIPLWAIVFALIFNVFNIPLFYVAETILNYFAQATIPLIMLAIGLSLDYSHIKNYLSETVFVSIVKLAIAPAIMLILLSFLNIKGMPFNIAMIEAGMSTAGNSLVLAMAYDLDKDLMASSIFVTVVLSVFTLTVIITLLTGGFLVPG